jgi:hypothetical protein
LLLYPHIRTRTDDPTIRRITTSPYHISFSTRPRRRRSLSTPSVMPPVLPQGCLAVPNSAPRPTFHNGRYAASHTHPKTNRVDTRSKDGAKLKSTRDSRYDRMRNGDHVITGEQPSTLDMGSRSREERSYNVFAPICHVACMPPIA